MWVFSRHCCFIMIYSFWILNFMSIANIYFANVLCDASCMFGFKVVGDFCGVSWALFHFENQCWKFNKLSCSLLMCWFCFKFNVQWTHNEMFSCMKQYKIHRVLLSLSLIILMLALMKVVMVMVRMELGSGDGGVGYEVMIKSLKKMEKNFWVLKHKHDKSGLSN